MTESASHLVALAGMLAVLIVLVFIALFGLRARAIWFERQTRRYLDKHRDYLDYVKSHLPDVEQLHTPAGKLAKTELKVLQNKLFEWMDQLDGVERDKLAQLCRDLGLAEMNLRRLRSEIHGVRLHAAYSLGMMQAGEAVPILQQLLDEERYGSPAFVIARAIARSAQSPEELDRMVRSIVKHGKHSHRLIAELLAFSRIDCTPMLLGYLREDDAELAKVALTGLQNRMIPGANRLLQPFVPASDAELRRLAVQALVEQGDLLPESQMKALLRHADPQVRLAVVEALGRSGQPYAVALLKEAMSDEDRRVRTGSARSLTMLEDAGFRALCEVAGGADEKAAALAVDTIREELARGALYEGDFEQAKRHSRRLGIYRQFAESIRVGWNAGPSGVPRGDTA